MKKRAWFAIAIAFTLCFPLTVAAAEGGESGDSAGTGEVQIVEEVVEKTTEKTTNPIVEFFEKITGRPETEEAAEEAEEAEEAAPADDVQEEAAEAAESAEKEIALRERADGMSAVVATIDPGTSATVKSTDGDWSLVEVDGVEGYIYKDDLKKISVVSETAEEPSEEETEDAEETESEDKEDAVKTSAKKVTIFTDRKAVMTEGDKVTLTSKLEGFDDCAEVRYIWKVDKGNGFEEIPGANQSSYTFTATAETLSWNWHLTVLYR